MNRYLRAAALSLVPIAMMLVWIVAVILLPPIWFAAIGLAALFCAFFWMFSRE